jgi:D-alanyl-D-alanine carboxypeptidase/Transglycosylase SLT domain
MEWKNESEWNDRNMVVLRTKVYEWEKDIYKEPNGTLPHRKFMRNYLLQLESGFDETARSRTGAKWMMQITWNVLADMKKRSYLFREQIRRIGMRPEVHDLFPRDIKNTLKMVIDNPNNPIKIDDLIKFLSSEPWKTLLENNWYINAYIGSIYLGILYESVNMETIPDEISYYRNLRWKLNYKNINTLIRDKLLSIHPNPGKAVKIPEITQETYKIFLDTLDENPKLVQSLFSARRYNWSDETKQYAQYGEGLREKDIYFIALGYATTMAMLSDPNYQNKYCDDKVKLVQENKTQKPLKVVIPKPSPSSKSPTSLQRVEVPHTQRLNLDKIQWVSWTVMVSEIKKDKTGKRISTVIGKNFDNLKETGWIASLTKLMTALVVYDICTQKWWDPSKKKITIKPEDKAEQTPWRTKRPSVWIIEDAVDAMVMKSDNTIANALSRELVWYDEFIRIMNQTAKRIGMNSSTFYTPSWLTEDGKANISTEIDIQKLVTHIIWTPYRILGPTQDTEQSYSSNQIQSGKLRSADRLFLEGMKRSYPDWIVVGTKTGYSKIAWKCVVTVIKHKNTWRLFSIVGFDMAKGDNERRKIRFQIINQLRNVVS